MGERDPGVAPAAAPAPWPQRAVLAGAILAIACAALIPGPAAWPPGESSPALVTRALGSALALVVGDRAGTLLGLLMLALAAVFACRSLEKRIGSSAPLLVALLICGSGAWALVWAWGAALAPLALAVLAFALAYGGGGAYEAPTEIYRPQEPGRLGALRWLVVGVLLAELVPTGPLSAALLLPAVLAVPHERRRAFLPLLLGGFAVTLAAELVVNGPRLVTGEIELAVDTFRLDPLLAGRGLLALLVGRNLGLVVGFAPLFLLLLLGRGSATRPALVAVALALPVLGVLLLPFDFAAGWINLSFLPLYGALWHLPVRPPQRWEWVATALLCGLVTWPLWAPPRLALAEGGAAPAAAWPRRYLPYEATLRSMPNSGEAELPGQGLRVRAVSGCRFLGDSSRFELEGGGPAAIWVAAPGEVGMIALEFGPGAPSSFSVSGATTGRTVFRPDGRVGFEVLLDPSRGRHLLWFGEGPLSVQLVELRLPGWESDRPLRFRLLAAPQP